MTDKAPLNQKQITHLVFSNPFHYLSCGLGSGLLPRMPGTWGSLIAIPFFYVLNKLPLWQYGLVLLITFAIGVALCGYSEKAFHKKDHSSIVWDEMVGMWITLCHAPFRLDVLIIGFILFRVLDITKPWPINWLQKHLPGGWGVMADDAAAAIIAFALLQGWIYIIR
jgi:phosphatidylglycerophosphatase A